MSDVIQQKVNDVAKALLIKNEKPTTRTVLDLLDGVLTSTSSVHKYLKVFWETQEAIENALHDQMGFSDGLAKVFKQEITRHTVEAEARYKAIANRAKDQAREAVDDLERAENDLHKQQALTEQRDKELTRMKDELAKATSSHDAIVIELRQQLKDLSDNREQLATTNKVLNTDLAKAQLKLENNQELVSEVKANNTELSKANKELNLSLVDNQTKIIKLESSVSGSDQLIEELKNSQNQQANALTKLEENHSLTVTKLEDTQVKLSRINGELQSELHTVKSTSAVQVSLIDELRNGQGKLENQLSESVKLIAQKDNTIANLKK